MRSREFSISPISVQIDCMKSLNKSESILKVYNLMEPENALFIFDNQSSFNHTVRLLPYGKYMIQLTILMLEVPEVGNTEKAFFEVIKTPLDIAIQGKSVIS